MLELKNISKFYYINDTKIPALKDISVSFRESEFVAILGHSGCGKTTLLNIIGGLDHYTDGDLIINGISTKTYDDRDLDAYRNHSIGFVFQSYNLIPHQTVLANVELALTIAGISASERKERATKALEQVGLADQLDKKPNQLSGGQMQRVAIARALVNNPDIILADEPTGALDSETSIQVMDILKEISKDKLVIMVTHNPELAESYATRIIHMSDGKLTKDSMPYDASSNTFTTSSYNEHISMTMKTAFSLSLNNLMTKKIRTFITAFAGSIGIIGIALILSLSNGVNDYIDRMQENTLSSYPITILRETTDTTTIITSMMELSVNDQDIPEDADKIYSNLMLVDIVSNFGNSTLTQNNLEGLKTYLDKSEELKELGAEIHYVYDYPLDIYTTDSAGHIMKADLSDVFENAVGDNSSTLINSGTSILSGIEIWGELPTNENNTVTDAVNNQYTLIYGEWPDEYDEIVIAVNQYNCIPDILLFGMGFNDISTLPRLINDALMGNEITPSKVDSWDYDEMCEKEYKLILPSERYAYNEETGLYIDTGATDTGLEYLYNNNEVGIELKITGIIKLNDTATSTSMFTLGYTDALTEYLAETAKQDSLVNAQLNNSDTDIFTGLPFRTDDTMLKTNEEKALSIKEYIDNLTDSDDDIITKANIYKHLAAIPDDDYIRNAVSEAINSLDRDVLVEQVAEIYAEKMGISSDFVMTYINSMSDEELYNQVADTLAYELTSKFAANVEAELSAFTNEELANKLMTTTFPDSALASAYDSFTPDSYSESSYEENLYKLGYITQNNPSSIRIYCETFDDKNKIAGIITDYNNTVSDGDRITYTDYMALLMSSITEIIGSISYLLVAFVSISLVVSSIMIGIITYISVLERTREIGILRAIGASKKDISNVFNAETLLVGFSSGIIGILLTIIINIPVTLVIRQMTGLNHLSSSLPLLGGIILVIISMSLTFIAGLIPARIAAKKDPVTALRTE